LAPEPPDISVVVLCYKSAETIIDFVESLVSSLNERALSWELILVGNYFENSNDKTPDVVKELAKKDTRIKAVTKVKEGMMGWDMKTGLRAATGKSLAVIDGDGQMPPEDVARVYEKLLEEGLDFAKTYRKTRGDGIYRTCISLTYNFLFAVLFPGLKSKDVNSKPKIMKREVYAMMNLESNGWFIDAEIMIQVRRMKLKIGEIPTEFRKINSRLSFVKAQAILEFVVNLIWHRILEFGQWFRK